MINQAVDVAGVDGGQVTLSPEDLALLAGGEDGRLLRAGDPGWDEATLIWNAMVARQPALVFRPSSVTDVATAVRFAADHGILLSVKGGGHNIAGTSLAPGALTLDMSLLRTVEVDPAAGVAQVGAGCLLKHVDAATQEHGLAAVLGFVSETGVAGLTLGGGFGYLTRRFGWTVDSLQAVEIVTADGQVRTASRDEEPELFWALRGGGGNFGIVTRFTFRLFEVGPSITGGLIAWSADEAEGVMAMFSEFTESAPREVTAALVVRLAPPAPFMPPEWHGKPIVAMVVCHSGPDPDNDLRPVRSTGRPVADVIMQKPYSAQQAMLDATQPKGLNYYWKSEFIPAFSPAYRTTVLENALQLTSPLSQAVAGFHIGGALNEREEDDGAVGNRDARYVSAIAACWKPGDERSDEHVAWARRSWEAVRPFSTGGNYVNFQVFDDDTSRTAAAYRANYARLQQVKASYDPDNLFRVNRNVSPEA
ncbi:MAG: FAD-binding oxidoreductase [Acidimicrobiia bacterium]